MTIDLPFNIGDLCWAMYNRVEKEETKCEHCKHVEKDSKYIKELRLGKIVSIDVFVRPNGISFWYICEFNGYSCQVGQKVWRTREEAENDDINKE